MSISSKNQDTVIEEIKWLAETGWGLKQTPHLKLTELYGRLLQERQKTHPGMVSVAKEFAAFFNKSYMWANNYALLARESLEVKNKIFQPNGSIRGPLPHILDMLRSEKRDWFLDQVTEQSDFRTLLQTFFRMLWEEEKQHLKGQSKESKRKAPPPPQQPPKIEPITRAKQVEISAISTLPEEEQLAALRKHFTLTSYRPDAKKADLPPIPQPESWDPGKITRVHQGVRVQDT